MGLMIKVKKLHRFALLPVRQHKAAAYDLYSCQDERIPAGERRLVGTGIAVEFPLCYVARLCDRSGMAAKKGLHVLAGVIDPDYRGEWKVVLLNTSDEDVVIEAQTRIAQVLFYKVADFPVTEVQELSDTARGAGGFGSTGDK
jgi:dUTP pyrophosphatase